MRALLLTLSLVLLVVSARAPTKQLHEHDFRPLLLRPAFARTISKPFLPMLVDVLWIRSLNAIGLNDSELKNRALHEYGVAITELDPRFYTAYEFIGLNIPFAVARNTFSGGDLSCDMFRRALQVFPGDLKFHMYLGFSLFHHQRKFLEAANVFAAAAKLPGALPFMAPLAARLKVTGGDAEDALDMTREMLKGDLDESVRGTLEKRVGELEIEVVLQRVDRASRVFFERMQVMPKSLDELRIQRLYEGPDFDPSGGLISIEADGKATSSSLKRRPEIYE